MDGEIFKVTPEKKQLPIIKVILMISLAFATDV